MIVIVSAFRNAANRLDPWFAQVTALRTLTAARAMAVVGDSTDTTEARIRQWADGDRLQRNWWFRYDHGVPEHGSTEHPDRLQALSGLLNASLDEIQRYITNEDTVVWVESDLFWSPYLFLQLQRFLRKPGVDVVAPLTFAGEAMYDVWGMRTPDGKRFGPFWPYGLVDDFTNPSPLVEMGSVGSCVAVKGIVAKSIRVSDGQALVGWCAAARAANYRIYCAKELRVDHPFSLEAQ